MGEGGFESFAVIGVGGGRQVVGDASAGELQVLDLLRSCFPILAPYFYFDILQRRFCVFSGGKFREGRTQALAARLCRKTGSGERMTPRIVDSATRARCSAKMPWYSKSAV